MSEPAILEAATWEAARAAMSLPEEFHGLPEQAELLLSHVDLRMLQGEENEQEVVAEPEVKPFNIYFVFLLFLLLIIIKSYFLS